MKVTVSPELWRRAEVVFETALDQSPAQRGAFVRRVCGEDGELRAAVESLLAFDSEEQEADAAEGRLLSAIPPAPSPWSGRRVGRYKILHPIGEGGMSRVFLAERAEGDIEQRVALKLIQETSRPAALRLFRRERQILARLQHPNIARFLDGGTTEEGASYAVLEYVEGTALTAYCDARRLGIRPRLELFLKACSAVQYAHQSLIVHCDLKPGNVLVSDEGEPKLLDFGIAKLLDLPAPRLAGATTTGERFLTPSYASPEQIEGRAVTMATDVYSLGVILYELLTGCLPHDLRQVSAAEAAKILALGPRPPSERMRVANGPRHDEDTDVAARAAARSTTSTRLGRHLKGDLDNIVGCCLRYEPRHRYTSVERLVEDLQRHLQGLPIRARPPHLAYRLGKFVRRHAFSVAAAFIAVVALTAFVVGTVFRAERVAHERDLARRAQREAEQVTRFLTDAFRLASTYQRADLGRSASEEVTVRQVLEYSAERVDRELAEQPLLRARLLNTIGLVYGDLGFIEEGVMHLREALAIRRRLLGDGQPEVVESLNSLGRLLIDHGRFNEAEPLLREALAAARQRHDLEAQRAASLSSLGLLVMSKGEYADAEPLLWEALAAHRSLESPEPRPLSETLLNLGGVLRLQGKLEEAEPLLREAVDILDRATGEEHPEMAAAQHELGWVLARKGDYDAAEPLLRRALATGRELLGPEHPDSLALLGSWGDFLAYRGDYPAAEPVLRELLETDRRIKGAQHPDVVHDLNGLALAVWQQGKLEAAEPLLREAVAIASEDWGLESAKTAVYLHNLGTLRNEMGDTAGAEPILRQALAIRAQLFGPTHFDVGITLTVLADLLLNAERLEEALDAADEAVALLVAGLGDDHWRTAIARSVRGDCLTRLGRFEEAETLLVDNLARIEAAQGTDSRPARSARRRLDRLYAARRPSGNSPTPGALVE